MPSRLDTEPAERHTLRAALKRTEIQSSRPLAWRRQVRNESVNGRKMSRSIVEPARTPTLEPQASPPRMGYAWYVVLVLMTCYTLSFIDRQILSLLVTPIKRDLAISD